MDLTEAKSSEHNLRNLYRRWAQFMEAESWAELATWRKSAPAAADGVADRSWQGVAGLHTGN